jgi:YrbI family 3-deoxy-D-manno-octulosonate 8-phosphate phosphatase
VVKTPQVLAIVHARGGSKSLPRKNIRRLHGHPLAAYSIASGLAARSVSRVIMSTDDEEIADIARQYGAEVPFMRPAELASDTAPDYPLFDHALTWLRENENYVPDIVVQLRPTTPFRPKGMIDEAVAILQSDPAADCVRGVTIPKQTPYKMWRPGANGYILPLIDTDFVEPYNMPRQKLPTAYFQTGHVDVIRTTTITQKKSLTGDLVRPIMLDPNYSVDIDTLADFELAERALEQKQLSIDIPRFTGDEHLRRGWPSRIDLVVFDFDGVFTDNRVLVMEDGREAVLCNRGDGLGLSRLREHGVAAAVISTETNPVVSARCRKLNLHCIQGQADKAEALRRLARERNVELERVIYIGNDLNDLGCMNAVGFAVAPLDAVATVLDQADLVLTSKGGNGAVRELCDLILQHLLRMKVHAQNS